MTKDKLGSKNIKKYKLRPLLKQKEHKWHEKWVKIQFLGQTL
ncbi:TPA: hypothetical protein ACIEVP_000091 [Streptococcus pyogenes]